MTPLENQALAYAIRRITHSGPRRNGRLIAIEALDGVGKTTISKALADRLIDGVSLSSPINDLHRSTRSSIDQLAFQEPLGRFRFYRDANRVDSAQILQPLLAQGKTVVLDRFTLSTIVGNVSLGANLCLDAEVLSDPEIPQDIVIPDATVFLSLKEQERIRRLSLRKETKPDRRIDENCAIQGAMSHLYAQLTQYGLIQVNIDDLDADSICDKIIDKLKSLDVLSATISR